MASTDPIHFPGKHPDPADTFKPTAFKGRVTLRREELSLLPEVHLTGSEVDGQGSDWHRSIEGLTSGCQWVFSARVRVEKGEAELWVRPPEGERWASGRTDGDPNPF